MAEGGIESAEYLQYVGQDSRNVDASGNFSVEVLRKACENRGLQLVSYLHETMATIRAEPTRATVRICNESVPANFHAFLFNFVRAVLRGSVSRPLS